jgi:hypothetical protein
LDLIIGIGWTVLVDLEALSYLEGSQKVIIKKLGSKTVKEKKGWPFDLLKCKW